MARTSGTRPPEQAARDSASPTHATILLIEDDPVVADMLRDRLGAKGYMVWHAASGAEAEAIGQEITPDAVLVDLGLPDANGLVLCADLRERWPVPIIVCTASTRSDDAVLSFRLGADDFVRKPFSTDELEARIHTALRRPPMSRRQPYPLTDAAPDSVLRVGTLAIDRARCSVSVGSTTVHLTPTGYRLLCALTEHPNQVIATERLAEQVWGAHDAGIERSLQVHIRRMRAKLNAVSILSPAIVAIRGFGYQLVATAESPSVPSEDD